MSGLAKTLCVPLNGQSSLVSHEHFGFQPLTGAPSRTAKVLRAL